MGIPEWSPTPLQAAVGAGHAEAASLLHGVEAALRVLQLGSGLPSAPMAADPDTEGGHSGGGGGAPAFSAAGPPVGPLPAVSAPPIPPCLLALAADCKVSRSRIVLMDAWEPLLAFSHGAPGFEAALFRCGEPPCRARPALGMHRPGILHRHCANEGRHTPYSRPLPFPARNAEIMNPPSPLSPSGGPSLSCAFPSGFPSPTWPTPSSAKAPSAPSTRTARPPNAMRSCLWPPGLQTRSRR